MLIFSFCVILFVINFEELGAQLIKILTLSQPREDLEPSYPSPFDFFLEDQGGVHIYVQTRDMNKRSGKFCITKYSIQGGHNTALLFWGSPVGAIAVNSEQQSPNFAVDKHERVHVFDVLSQSVQIIKLGSETIKKNVEELAFTSEIVLVENKQDFPDYLLMQVTPLFGDGPRSTLQILAAGTETSKQIIEFAFVPLLAKGPSDDLVYIEERGEQGIKFQLFDVHTKKVQVDLIGIVEKLSNKLQVSPLRTGKCAIPTFLFDNIDGHTIVVVTFERTSNEVVNHEHAIFLAVNLEDFEKWHLLAAISAPEKVAYHGLDDFVDFDDSVEMPLASKPVVKNGVFMIAYTGEDNSSMSVYMFDYGKRVAEIIKAGDTAFSAVLTSFAAVERHSGNSERSKALRIVSEVASNEAKRQAEATGFEGVKQLVNTKLHRVIN
jgi:hypothetical protein